MNKYALKQEERKAVSLRWYEYCQNNSGGSFVMNDAVSVYVLVQASNQDEADKVAKSNGIYFNAVHKGYDCDCCGDRWYEGEELDAFRTYQWNGSGSTKHEFTDVRDYAQNQSNIGDWNKEGKPYVIVYYADGTKELFYKE